MTSENHWAHELAMQRGIIIGKVEHTLRQAERAKIIPESISHVRGMRDESLRLFLAGEVLASMWAGQATWEAAASLHYATHDKKPLLAGQKQVQASINGNLSRQVAATAEHKAWQKAADVLWKNRQHAEKSASDIAKLIDQERWNTVRRHISKPM